MALLCQGSAQRSSDEPRSAGYDHMHKPIVPGNRLYVPAKNRLSFFYSMLLNEVLEHTMFWHLRSTAAFF